MHVRWIGSALISTALLGCMNQDRYTEDQVLLSPKGVSETGFSYVNKEVLNLGWRVYKRNCAACHGDAGDGQGRAAPKLIPPPRDLTQGLFKFGGVVAGTGLPHDEDIERILRDGLHGTGMLEWDIREGQLQPLIWFIKSLSEEGKGWRNADAELGESIEIPKDPYAGNKSAQKEAADRGNALYHADATCWKCHPAYESRETIWDQAKTLGAGAPQFAADMYMSKPKESKYAISAKGNTGFEPGILSIMPPDFTMDEIRSGDGAAELYRVLSAGVDGSGMPSWREFYIDDIEKAEKGEGRDPIWDLVYYVMELHNETTTEDAVRKQAKHMATLAAPWVAPSDKTQVDTNSPDDTAEATDSGQD